MFTGKINFTGDLTSKFTMSNEENSLYLRGRTRNDRMDVVVRSQINVSDFVVAKSNINSSL